MGDKQVWQIAAGTGNRDYKELFYDWGIATIGPGFEGEWDEIRYKNSNKVEERDKSLLKRFATEVKPGDYIILKVGKGAEAIGVVEEYENGKAYFWNENFRYIDGWQLGHCLKVKWRKPRDNQKLGLKGLAVSKFCNYWVKKNIKKIEIQFKSFKPVKSKSLEDIERLETPKRLDNKNYEERLKQIFNDTDKLKKFRKEIFELQNYAINHDTYDYSEEEAKIFFIVPILKALGWSNEHIAIEHEDVDILLSYNGFISRNFNTKEKNNDVNKVDFIIESKRVSEGLVYATDQIKNYSEKFKKDEIKYIVSNGLVSYICKKNEDNKSMDKIACLDIENLWIEHLPYDNKIKGTIEFIKLMSYKKVK